MGCVMAQAVIHWPLNVETWLHSKASPHGICGGQSGTRTRVSLSTSVVFGHYHFTIASYTLIHLSLILCNLSN